MKRRHVVLVSVVVLAVLGSVRTARADAAPPPPPPAGSVEEGSEYPTNIQMVSEDVLMTIGDEIAYVKATFNMRNQGTTEESFDVRFPIDSHLYEGIATVHNFAAYVDGETAEVAYVSYSEAPLLHWATWRVTFPAGLPVTLGVIYQVDPYYWGGGGFQAYFYILETGAGWYGPIGEGTVIVRLPYEVDETNTVLDDLYPSSYTISGTDIIWHFTDLEPTGRDNIRVEILSPRVLRDIQSAQQQVDSNPGSIDAHLKLAHVLVGALSFHHSLYELDNDIEMANRACVAYKRALELAPRNVDVYVEYLDFLVTYSYELAPSCPPEQIGPVLAQALALAPTDVRLLEIRHKAWEWQLLATPTAALHTPDPNANPFPTYSIPTLIPSPTRISAFTLTSVLTPTPTPLPAPPPADTPKIGVWVAVAAAVIGGAWVGVRAYRRKAR